MNFLLSCEKNISDKNYDIRKKLYDEFMTLPKDFVSKMRHLQPQIGCFNNCSFCSKFSICKSEYWSLDTLKNIISALKFTAKNYTSDDILLAWDRKEHRVGVVFPYLNNDISSYPYLKEFITLCYRELGSRTRISTVGFSRHNKVINKIHQDINNSELIYALGGVRLSISQYGRVWEEEGEKTSLDEYVKDLGNFLKIYRPYFDKMGVGARKMCCELRYNPLVENSEVIVFEYNKKFVIAAANYLFISNEENIKLKETFISDPYKHSLEFTNEGIKFTEYNLPFKVSSKSELIKYLDENELKNEKEVEIYLFKNKDGEYYSINPKLTKCGNYGMNIYPLTEIRTKSGYIITERFFLNALYNYKNRKNLALEDLLNNCSFDDCAKVIEILKEYATYYKEIGKEEKFEYINKHVIPLIEVYIEALKEAGYSPDVFFDKNFTIDTGIICNLGRAIGLFKNLTKYINEPLTPTHERNYGRHCSAMKQENFVWLLGCDFNDKLSIEKLELFNTASVEGQASFTRKIEFEGLNEKVNEKDKYLYPGEVE